MTKKGVMMIKYLLVIVCSMMILPVNSQVNRATGNPSVPVYLDESKSIELRVKDALSKMTVAEKVELSAGQSRFSSPGVPRLGIPEIWMSDGPHGIRFEIEWDSWNSARWTSDSCTAFPALTCLAASWNPRLSYIYGKAIGEEARYRKKEVLLGPGVNIYRHPMNGRNFEYMGEDPYLSSVMVVPYIKGVQENGVAACVKHFALNNQEHLRMRINIELSDRALQEIYLPAFKAAVIDGHVWTIMGAFNKIRGQFACHNDMLLNDILKNDWAFDGVVISDWGGTHDTQEAIYNGLDIEMGRSAVYLSDPYMKLALTGKVPMEIIDEKASRVLKLIFRTAMNTKKPWGSFATEEHARVSREIAGEGIVLLKNTNKLLPATPGKYKNIAVIGENAVKKLTVGGGSSELKVKKEVSPLEGLSNVYGKENIKFSMGYSSNEKANKDSLLQNAVNTVKGADLVLYFGGLNKDESQDSEGSDRTSYDLPYGQDELINALLGANSNVAIVMISGNAVAMPWEKNSTTIVQSWYLGSEAGNALADVISGKINPGGKLPFSYAVKLEDYGAMSYGPASYPGVDSTVTYKEDILVGYRWFDTKKILPLFPFGHGLSYTTFGYGKISSDNKEMGENDIIRISIPVTNTGSVAGSEVVQLYIKDEKSTLLRPDKELKGFVKVKLNPGETASVDFDIDSNSLKYYNDQLKKWVAEPGRFIAYVGSSSRDIKGSVKFELK